LGRRALGLVTIFYSLRFEISLFVASYDSQGHGGDIRTSLHTGNCLEYYQCRADRTENPVVLLRHEYRAVDKSRDSQPVLLECDVMRLHRAVFTEQ
jgi:hypothetical protein